jgi:hypothetical protein
MMIVGAACMAASAYLIGDMINQAYVNRNFPAILALSIATTILYTVRGAATYGQAVLMSRIGTRIVAENQRRVFDKLLNEGLGYFADRHSSEFIARLTTGGTESDALAGELRDPAASAAGAAQAHPPAAHGRPYPVRLRHPHHGDRAGSRPGHGDRQGLHARRRDARAP